MNVMKLYRLIALLLMSWMVVSSGAYAAVQESRPSPSDSRFRYITYHPDIFHKYIGYYDYQASIVFAPDEVVQTIAMSDTTGWMIQPTGNRMYIKPIGSIAATKTNMLLMTNKRIYHFLLEGRFIGPEGLDDPDLVLETRFVYPETNQGLFQEYQSRRKGPDLSDPSQFNFNYSLSGSEYIAPIRVFDDGEFTYFEFSKRNAELPAIFLVDSTGREALVNFRVEENFVVVERVASRYTLRHGPDATCVFNELRPLPIRKVIYKK